MLYVKNGAKFVATNLDSTLPLAKFEIPELAPWLQR